MSFKLQSFGIRESRYERPLDAWVCGRAANGEPCELGPTPTGGCSRAEGETACRPRRSLSTIRARLTFGAVALALLGLALGLAGPWASGLASPGELSVHHARKTRETARGEAGCRDCHVAATSASAFASSLLSDAHRERDSGLCLDCHALGEHAMDAHGTAPAPAPARLATVAATAGGGEGEAAGARRLSCGTCHYEHRGTRKRAGAGRGAGAGAGADLVDLDDVRCQACHRARFESFGSGHPELTGYPREKERIRFDHETHRYQNFSKERNGVEDRAFRCTDCHQPDAARQSMLLGSYESTCAACHDGQIVTSGDVAFLSLAGLDTYSLPELEVRIGLWPSEEEPAPSEIGELLLRGGEDEGDYLETLRGLDPLDLASATDGELVAVEQYAWGVKRLLSDLRDRGREAIAERLEQALSEPVPEPRLARLLAGLPIEVLDDAADAWFPSLVEELESASRGNPPPTELAYPEPAERRVEPGPGDWHRDDYEMRLLYRPAGHADPLVRAWIELAADNESLAPLFDALTDDFAAGRCAKCHVLGDEPAPVRWTSKADAPYDRPATRFSHAPHVSLFPGEDRCAACHQTATATATAADTSEESGDGDGVRDEAGTEEPEAEAEAAPAGDFAPLRKESCASCHRPEAASDACVSCHNYHLGPRSEPTLAPR